MVNSNGIQEEHRDPASRIQATLDLYDAIARDDLDKVNEKIAAGAYLDNIPDLGVTAFNYGTPLHDAAENNTDHSALVIAALVAAGAEINSRADQSHKTPLELAAMMKAEANFSALLNLGADPYRRDRAGRVACEFDASGRSAELLKLFSRQNRDSFRALVRSGQDLSAQASDGDGNLSLQGLLWINAGILPDIASPDTWKGREAEGLNFADGLSLAMAKDRSSHSQSPPDLSGLRRAVVQSTHEGPAVERFRRGHTNVAKPTVSTR